MRMFLVGMCDIFLILYLTTLSGIDPSQLSDITVADYEQLEQEQQKLARTRAELEEKLAALSQALREAARDHQSELNAERQAAAERLAALNQQTDTQAQALAAAAAEAQQLREAQRQATERLGDVEKSLQEAVAEKASLETQLSSREQALIEQQQTSETLRTTLAQTESSAQQREQELARKQQDLSDALMQAQKQAEDAEARAREAQERAEMMAAAAEAAEAAREKALSRATQSEREQQRALLLARGAQARARVAATEAAKQRTQAAQAQRRAREKSNELAKVLQPTEEAYQRNVRARMGAVSIEVRRDALLGDREYSQTFRVALLRQDGAVLAVLPLSALSLDQIEDPADFEKIDMRIGGRPAQWLLLHPSGLAALALSTRPPASLEPQTGALMPTLFAVRASGDLGFFDRVREVRDDYFPFQRDRLRSLGKGRWQYRSEGIRGTGDFAQYIRRGDQILDLEGALVGVALERNEVVLFTERDSWQVVDLGLSAEEVARRISSILER